MGLVNWTYAFAIPAVPCSDCLWPTASAVDGNLFSRHFFALCYSPLLLLSGGGFLSLWDKHRHLFLRSRGNEIPQVVFKPPFLIEGPFDLTSPLGVPMNDADRALTSHTSIQHKKENTYANIPEALVSLPYTRPCGPRESATIPTVGRGDPISPRDTPHSLVGTRIRKSFNCCHGVAVEKESTTRGGSRVGMLAGN